METFKGILILQLQPSAVRLDVPGSMQWIYTYSMYACSISIKSIYRVTVLQICQDFLFLTYVAVGFQNVLSAAELLVRGMDTICRATEVQSFRAMK